MREPGETIDKEINNARMADVMQNDIGKKNVNRNLSDDRDQLKFVTF